MFKMCAGRSFLKTSCARSLAVRNSSYNRHRGGGILRLNKYIWFTQMQTLPTFKVSLASPSAKTSFIDTTSLVNEGGLAKDGMMLKLVKSEG
jgi:hypothetical protein